MESYPIEARSPRRGSVGYYGYDDDYDGYYWPLYLYIIVAFIGLFCSLFFWSTVFYCVRGEHNISIPSERALFWTRT